MILLIYLLTLREGARQVGWMPFWTAMFASAIAINVFVLARAALRWNELSPSQRAKVLWGILML